MTGHLQEWLDLAMFVSLCALVLLGYPISFTLAGTALIFALIGMAFSVFDPDFLGVFPNRIYGVMTNEVLIAVPLFIFMGMMLERSKVAEELLDTMGQLFGRLRGGLGISVSVVGALLAASTGIVGATVVTMGLLSLPTMLRRGYEPQARSARSFRRRSCWSCSATRFPTRTRRHSVRWATFRPNPCRSETSSPVH